MNTKKMLFQNAMLSIITTISIAFFITIFVIMNGYIEKFDNGSLNDGKYTGSFLVVVLYYISLAMMIVSVIYSLVYGVLSLIESEKQKQNKNLFIAMSISTMMFGLFMTSAVIAIIIHFKEKSDIKMEVALKSLEEVKAKNEQKAEEQRIALEEEKKKKEEAEKARLARRAETDDIEE